jgi:hypothetical protein
MARDHIGQLWIAYAQTEMGLKQYKKATQIFDDALNDPIASSCCGVYLAYANFCEERFPHVIVCSIRTFADCVCILLLLYRGKIGNAQKVFLRGLQAQQQLSNTDLATLWQKFLSMMKRAAGADGEQLTMDSLYESVKLHFGAEAANIVPPSIIFGVDGNRGVDGADSSMAESKESESHHHHHNIKSADLMTKSSAVPSSSSSSSHLSAPVSLSNSITTSDTTSSSDSINSQASSDVNNNTSDVRSMAALIASNASKQDFSVSGVMDDLDDVSMFTVEELRRLYHSKPPKLLFCTPDQEPMRSGIQQLTDHEIRLLEDRFHCRLPHKNLLNTLNSDAFARCLDTIESLWTLQALKERHFESWFFDLRQMHLKEVCM